MCCTTHDSQGQLWFVSKESTQTKSSGTAALDVWCSWPFFSRERGERRLKHHMTLPLHASAWQLGSLYGFHRAKHCYVRDEWCGSVTYAASTCHCAVCARVPTPTQDICWHSLLSLCWIQTLGKVSKKDLERMFHPPFNSLTESCSLNLQEPMHLCNVCTCVWRSSATCRK